ncbi:MAG: universal stress protein [Thermacetogeniaceae bacterium]
MFKKILVGYDGSENAKKALMVALDLAKKYGSEITAASVAHVPDYAATRDEVDGAIEDARRFFEKGFEEAKDLASKEGVNLNTVVLVGHPGDALTHFAEKEGYDLLVVGARGLSGIKRYIIGSVSAHVVRLAHCPVLVVKK